jgi:hypothetical protein
VCTRDGLIFLLLHAGKLQAHVRQAAFEFHARLLEGLHCNVRLLLSLKVLLVLVFRGVRQLVYGLFQRLQLPQQLATHYQHISNTLATH